LLPLSSLNWKSQQDKSGMIASSAFSGIKLTEDMVMDYQIIKI
jgi:hypothetical protein